MNQHHGSNAQVNAPNTAVMNNQLTNHNHEMTNQDKEYFQTKVAVADGDNGERETLTSSRYHQQPPQHHHPHSPQQHQHHHQHHIGHEKRAIGINGEHMRNAMSLVTSLATTTANEQMNKIVHGRMNNEEINKRENPNGKMNKNDGSPSGRHTDGLSGDINRGRRKKSTR